MLSEHSFISTFHFHLINHVFVLLILYIAVFAFYQYKRELDGSCMVFISSLVPGYLVSREKARVGLQFGGRFDKSAMDVREDCREGVVGCVKEHGIGLDLEGS